MNATTVVIIIVMIVLIAVVLVRPRRKNKAARKGGSIGTRQVTLRIVCDEGYVADFLRELAIHVEEMEEDDNLPLEYESFHGFAELDFESEGHGA